ncbi:MAG: hypothetical protein ACJ74O_17630 [Frankiaceae bacterium]
MTAPDYRTAQQNEQSTGLSDDVRERGKEVGGHARTAAVDVKDSATDRARDVAAEAKSQARDLIDESRTTLSNHANTQVNRLGETLQQLADELHRMARMGDDNGTAAPLVRELAERTQGVARHVQGREATDLLQDARNLARRRPAAFLAGAAGLGFLVGRLGRGLKDAQSDSGYASGTWAGEPYPAHGYPTGPVGSQQPVGGMPLVGTDVGVGAEPMVTGGYATGAATGGVTGTADDGLGTSGFGTGSTGYATEGDATQVLPPVTTASGTTGESDTGIDALLEDDRPEGDRYGA